MKKRFFYVAILSLLVFNSFGQGGYTPIPKLKITTTPDTNNSTTEVLVRDATTGNVGKVAKSSLAGTLDSVTDAGATTNNVISTGGVGINTTTPQAIFDVVSTSSGVLIPRMTTTQRDAIVTPINSMLIYNSTTNQFEYYKFGSWISLTDSTTVSNLQTVTDAGATTTNNITIQGGEDDGVVTLFKNDETANVSVEWAENKVALSAKDNAVNFGDTNLKSLSGGISTQPNQNYVLPDKATGSYTLATISDLETGYIPLTGTTSGNPVSGDIEMNSFSSIKAENTTHRSVLNVDVDNNLQSTIYTENKDTNDIAGLSTNSSNGVSMFVSKPSESQNVAINVDIIGIIVTDYGTTQRGLQGGGDYSANILDLDYTQKIYVDNQRGKLIQLTTTEILALTPEIGRLYYNTTINEVVFYNGTTWKKLSHSNM